MRGFNKKLKDDIEESDDNPSRSNPEENRQNDQSPDVTEESSPPHPQPHQNRSTSTTPRSVKSSQCRFCKTTFKNPQALGGHMNRHRQEREKEELARARDLLQTRGAGNYHAGGYYAAGPSYMPNYSQEDPYQGGGNLMASQMGAPPRQMLQSSNPVFPAPQMNPSFVPQPSAQSVYHSQLQHGASSSYSEFENAPRPPHFTTGVPQTSYTSLVNPGQYTSHGQTFTSLLGLDSELYMDPHNGFAEIAQQQSNTFTSQLSGGSADSATLVAPERSNCFQMFHSHLNPDMVQFVDQSGNIPQDSHPMHPM